MEHALVATTIVKPRDDGTTVIPASFGEELGITSDTLLTVMLVGGEIRARPAEADVFAANTEWLVKLYKMYAPVREEFAQYSDEEIDAWIDLALAEVRAEQDARARRSDDIATTDPS